MSALPLTPYPALNVTLPPELGGLPPIPGIPPLHIPDFPNEPPEQPKTEPVYIRTPGGTWIQQTVTEAVKTIQDANSQVITDWKNYQVTVGNTYEITFDVNIALQRLFTGVLPIIGFVLPFWMNRFLRNSRGWTLEFINRLLSYSTSVGILKDKIKILPEDTGFSSDFKQFKLTFQVIENPWPIFAIIAAVIGIVGFFTVREVRLIYTRKKTAADIFSGLAWPIGILFAIILSAIIIPKMGK